MEEVKLIETRTRSRRKFSKRIKALVITLLLVVIAGAIFYWWQILPAGEPSEKTQPPTLFNKEDYKVEDRQDGKYIVIDKAGFSCKVPEGWRVEIQNTADPEQKEGFVNILSSDAQIEHGILVKGCGISLLAENNQTNNQQIENYVKILKENPAQSSTIREGYNFKIISINNIETLLWETKKSEFGQTIGINIAKSNEINVNLDTRIPQNEEEKCLSAWGETLKTVSIK